MERAHCFVIPSSFNDKKHSHYRYSFPTKLPELLLPDVRFYLTVQKRPQQTECLKHNSIGLRLNDRSVPKLVNALEDLVTKYGDCVSQFASASPTLMENFSADSVRRRLKKLIGNRMISIGSLSTQNP